MTTIGTVFQKVEKACEILGVALLTVLCVLAALQIAFRYTGAYVDISAAWTEELARYFFVLMILVGVPYTMRSGDNISIRPILRKLPAKWQKGLLTVSNGFIVLLSGIMVYSAYIVSQRTLGTTLATIDWLRTGYVHVVLAVAFLLTALFAIEETAQLWIEDDLSVVASEPDVEDPPGELDPVQSNGGAK